MPTKSPLLAISLTALLRGCVHLPGGTEVAPGADPNQPADITVPRMEPAPKVDGDVFPGEWAKGTSFRGNFTIGPGLLYNGTYPFEITFGANDSWFFFMARVHNVSLTHRLDHADRNETWAPDDLMFYLAPHFEGPLTVPSDWKVFSHVWDQGMFMHDGYWDGNEWKVQREIGSKMRVFPDFQPESNRSRFTLTWEGEIARHSPHPEHDGVDLGPAGAFRLCLAFARQTTGKFPDGDPRNDPTDDFPGDGYTPRVHFDAATWLKVRMSQ